MLLAACSGSGAASEITSGPQTTAETAAPPIPATTPTTPKNTTELPAATASSESAVPETSVPAPEAWAPIGAGQYEVGVATIVIEDPDGIRPLTVDVWFPLGGGVDATTLAPQQYTLLPGVYYESPTAFAATADHAADGPFPLIVYSHGSGGLRYIHSAYTEQLASHGYIVVAPDHTGNTAVDRLAGSNAAPEEIAFNRPTDVGRVIDAFVDPSHPTAGPYATHVDAERVVVTGHSFGGFTPIATVTGFANELGEVPADDRVDAIIVLAPAVSTTLLSDELIATIDVPMMVLVGTDDVTTPVDPNVTRLWDASTSTPAYRIELVAGEHQTFTDICSYQDSIPALANVPEIVTETIDTFAVEGCSPGDIDDTRANEITTTYVLGFLDQVLHGGNPIDPATVTPPDDVIFQSR